MKPAVTMTLKIFFILFYFAASTAAQSKPVINDTQSWLRSGWSNLITAEGVEQREKQISSPNCDTRCEQYNFDLFFMLFSEDKYFQESTTIFPLKVTTVSYNSFATQEEIDKNGDSITTHRFLTKKKEGDGVTIFPNRHQRTTGNLDYSVETDSPKYGMNSIILRREGTGIHYTFIFVWKGCWLLSEVIDSST